MPEVNISRWLNYLTGGSQNELLCSRLHREKKVFWIFIVNTLFWDREHVLKAYRWERRHKWRERSNGKDTTS